MTLAKICYKFFGVKHISLNFEVMEIYHGKKNENMAYSLKHSDLSFTISCDIIL